MKTVLYWGTEPLWSNTWISTDKDLLEKYCQEVEIVEMDADQGLCAEVEFCQIEIEDGKWVWGAKITASCDSVAELPEGAVLVCEPISWYVQTRDQIEKSPPKKYDPSEVVYWEPC